MTPEGEYEYMFHSCRGARVGNCGVTVPRVHNFSRFCSAEYASWPIRAHKHIQPVQRTANNVEQLQLHKREAFAMILHTFIMASIEIN